MKVRVELANEDNVLPDFPCLMISNDQEIILLVTELDGADLVGTVVEDKTGLYGFGKHNEDWNYYRFSEFAGTVTLSN